MSAIDFSEIPFIDRIKWEMFARDFLEISNFTIMTEPSEGPDGGMDLIVESLEINLDKTEKIRWLVSCKNKGKSNKAVGVSDELNIRDRIADFNCDGFIGFYSTWPSTALYSRLQKVGIYKVFDCTKI
ncbi:MAG: hypothetical protein SNJ77_10505 [Cytophagales bacterium]